MSVIQIWWALKVEMKFEIQILLGPHLEKCNIVEVLTYVDSGGVACVQIRGV